MKILICGDRKYDSKEKIFAFVKSLPPDTIIIEGEAKGADTLAREAGEEYGFVVERYPADWSIGKKAGPIRNTQMLKE